MDFLVYLLDDSREIGCQQLCRGRHTLCGRLIPAHPSLQLLITLIDSFDVHSSSILVKRNTSGRWIMQISYQCHDSRKKLCIQTLLVDRNRVTPVRKMRNIARKRTGVLNARSPWLLGRLCYLARSSTYHTESATVAVAAVLGMLRQL